MRVRSVSREEVWILLRYALRYTRYCRSRFASGLDNTAGHGSRGRRTNARAAAREAADAARAAAARAPAAASTAQAEMTRPPATANAAGAGSALYQRLRRPQPRRSVPGSQLRTRGLKMPEHQRETHQGQCSHQPRHSASGRFRRSRVARLFKPSATGNVCAAILLPHDGQLVVVLSAPTRAGRRAGEGGQRARATATTSDTGLPGTRIKGTRSAPDQGGVLGADTAAPQGRGGRGRVRSDTLSAVVR